MGITWPLKYHEIPRESIVSVRLLDRDALREEIGWGVRIGAGGFGGGFGWLWTQRHGIVQMYVSRTDRFVWIERDHDRPWLVTPEQPECSSRPSPAEPVLILYPDSPSASRSICR